MKLRNPNYITIYTGEKNSSVFHNESDIEKTISQIIEVYNENISN